MLSDSVYNYATTRRGTGDQDSDSQYEGQAQLQITSIQKPRNKRKNFKPISSRMVEVSDESEKEDDELDGAMEESSSEILEYERKTMLLPAEDRSKQRLNNNEVSPMDLSVATRPPSSEADDDSGDSLRHKFILEQLRSQKLYSPGTEVSLSLSLYKYIYVSVCVTRIRCGRRRGVRTRSHRRRVEEAVSWTRTRDGWTTPRSRTSEGRTGTARRSARRGSRSKG